MASAKYSEVDVEDGDEGDIEGVKIPYAKLKSMHSSMLSKEGAEFEVIVDDRDGEEEDAAEASKTSRLASNFFYDDKLLNCLSSGCVSGNSQQNLDVSGSDDELEPFEKLARNMEDLTDHGGVVKKIVVPGVGKALTVGTSVRFHYSCYLEYGDEPLDSTFLRDKMGKTRLGDGDVLPGLVIALQSMRLKETAHFIVQPRYAFGQVGCPPRIPPNAALFYEVRLEAAVDCAAADDMEADGWSFERHNTATFEERLDTARAYHRKGNSYYSNGNLNRARRCYQRGVWLMVHAPLQDEAQETTSYTLQAKLFANTAKVYLDERKPTCACTQCRLALELPFSMPVPLKAKVYFRFATAKSLLNSFDDARKFFLLTQQLKPNCPDIAKNLEELTVKQRKYQAQEKFMYKKMFAISNGNGNVDSDDSTSKDVSVDCAGSMDRSVETDTSNCLDTLRNYQDGGSLDRLLNKQHTTVDEGVIITEVDSEASTDQADVAINNVQTAVKNLGIRDFSSGHGEIGGGRPFNIESDETVGRSSKSWGHEVESDPSLSKLSRKLKPDFVDIVLSELNRLTTTSAKEVLFPSNLCIEEITFLASTASSYHCQLEFLHKGNTRYPKVVKV